MAEFTQKDFIQNLNDAGCVNETINKCVSYLKQNNDKQLLRVLKQHRQDLLDKLHGCQKEIDCLDYLIFMVEKGGI